MKIKDQIEIFPDPQLRHVLTGSQEEVEASEKKFTGQILKNLAFIEKYLQCIENQATTKQRKTAGRLIGYIGKEKSTLSGEVAARIDKITDLLIDEKERSRKETKKKVAAQEAQNMEISQEELGKFPEATTALSQFGALSNDIQKLQEMKAKVDLRSEKSQLISEKKKKIEEMKDPVETNRFLDMEGQLENSQKMVLVGVPKRQIEDVQRYWEMIVKKNVPLMVSLCSSCQWQEIMPFWKRGKIDRIAEKLKETTGTTIACEGKKVLYVGKETVLDKGKQRQVKIIERTYTLTDKDGNKRTATHLHYLHWPDHEVAPNLEAFDVLVKRRHELVNNLDAPIAINCQGGIGRTGELALFECFKHEIDHQQKMGKSLDEITLNLPETIYGLRQFAPHLCGSEIEQLAQVCQFVDRYYQELQSKKEVV
jgi:hypothetical protein